MKIKKIELFSTSEKYFRSIPIAVGTNERRENIIVKIIADNGLVGYGEGSPLVPSYSGETRNQMVDDIIKRIAPDILGQKINSINDILRLIDKIYHNKYYFMCAIAAVDIALFDLLGKLKKKPVFELIRNHLRLRKFKEIPELPANFTVSRNANNKITEMIKEAEDYINKGYSIIKVKIGIYKNSDISSIKKLYFHIKKRYPDRKINLFADGNQAYKTVGEASNIIKKIKNYIICLEQPFHRNVPHLSAKLNQKIKNAPLLITDEGSASIEEIENVLVSNAAGGALLKMVRSGGFSYIIWLVTLLKKYPHFKLCPCSMTETGIGTTANLHSALIVYEHCDLRLGFGFDGPMQVIGNSYKNGKDTVIYLDKKKGLLTKNKKNVAVYDSKQIIGDGKGLGIILNQRYIDKITIKKTIIYLKSENVIKEKVTKKNKVKKVVGKQKEILEHPRY